nr:MAG: hypothetical protein 1 [Leviviridae sp.]
MSIVLPSLLLGTEYTNTPSEQTYYTPSAGSKDLILGDWGHYGWPNPSGPGNCGGPFLLKQTTTNYGLVGVGEAWRGGALDQRFVGSMCAQAANPTGSVVDTDGSAWGADAYNRMKPTKPMFQGLNAVYELREVPEQLRQGFTKDLIGASNYWLALQFGWKPLLQDIRNLVDTQSKIEKRLAWLMRHNGKPVRRRVVLSDTMNDPVVTRENPLGGNGLHPLLVSQYYSGNERTVKQSSGTRIWASARFRYWLPPGPQDIAWKRWMKAYLFGLTPTPSVIWKAMPWSWMVDWFTNVGHVISNMDGGVANRLASDYFYVMREDWARADATNWFTTKRRDGTKVSHTSTTTRIKSKKSRVAGDPFGFNTNQNSLSSMQLSILGALGMSRLR